MIRYDSRCHQMFGLADPTAHAATTEHQISMPSLNYYDDMPTAMYASVSSGGAALPRIGRSGSRPAAEAG